MERKIIATSLGAWGGIEADRNAKHKLTFPLAIVQQVLQDAGFAGLESWEGDDRPSVEGARYLMVSVMDSRHMWRVVPWLREVHIPIFAADRGESHPIVIAGGQAICNPAPVEPFFDVLFIGEAEAGLVQLMAALEGGGSRWERLERAALVPGCLVPGFTAPDQVIHQQFSDDVSITLRSRLSVSLNDNPRIEIARGCPKKCGFCVLGWRVPYRENSAESISAKLTEIRDGGRKQVHLSAGDAESHREINAIRAHAAALGMRDNGWTGRLDTVKDCHVAAGKMFAFGLEGMSHRLRIIAGKHALSDDMVVEQMGNYWRLGGRRAMFHLIGGLPGEHDGDSDDFRALLERLEGEAASTGERIHLDIGRQPFGPLPHTPMQWFAPGITTERIRRAVAPWVGHPTLNVTDKAGLGGHVSQAYIQAVTMRGGEEIRPLLVDGPPRLPEQVDAARLAADRWLRSYGLDPARYFGALDPDAPLPWDRVVSGQDKGSIRRAYDRLVRMTGTL